MGLQNIIAIVGGMKDALSNQIGYYLLFVFFPTALVKTLLNDVIFLMIELFGYYYTWCLIKPEK